MRQKIYYILKRSDGSDSKSKFYDVFICTIALISIVPLMFKRHYSVFDDADRVSVAILFMDYILRWTVSDYVMKKGIKSFFIYPITFYALIDIISFLPTVGILGNSFRVLRILRLLKIFHYSKNIEYILQAFAKRITTLYSVLVMAIGYIFVSALVMFSYEPDTFENFFDSLYWATTALTTVGYGDVCPKTDVGRVISMVSSLFGIAVIALPAGIITAGFVDEINASKKNSDNNSRNMQ